MVGRYRVNDQKRRQGLMKHLFLKKKRITLLAALLIAAVTAIAAYAYFTANGTGSGTATVGTSSTVTLHGNASGTLYPGSTVPVSFTVDNPSTGHQQLGTIYLAGVKACTGASSSWDPSLNSGAGGCSNSGTEQTTCESVDAGNTGDANASNFYMADVVANQDIAGSSSGVSVTTGGTLKLNNLNASQDSCKNASLYLQLATR
jgi:putative alpha-1,2-mannosidase